MFLAFQHYIIHFPISAPAIFVFHSTSLAPCCTVNQHKHEVPHCHVVFHHHFCFACIVSMAMKQTPSGLTVVIFFSMLVWTLNALSLKALLCGVSTLQSKSRRTQCPVISLDAAHLRSEYKGMLYIASVLLGGDNIYPIGFMIANGNEDRKTWTKMPGLLKEAFLIICKQGFQTVLN
jgi:hypothetical protein